MEAPVEVRTVEVPVADEAVVKELAALKDDYSRLQLKLSDARKNYRSALSSANTAKNRADALNFRVGQLVDELRAARVGESPCAAQRGAAQTAAEEHSIWNHGTLKQKTLDLIRCLAP